MKNIVAITTLFLCALSATVSADDCNASQSPLIDLLNQYSPAAVDTGTLIGILNIHGFTALTSDGVVYVLPYQVAEASDDKFGSQWEG